jgi:excisionase family DNA binding protein
MTMNSNSKSGSKVWLTVEECANYLGISKRAVYNHVHRGRLPSSKLGARLLFDAALVDIAIQSPNRKRYLPSKTPMQCTEMSVGSTGEQDSRKVNLEREEFSNEN